MWYIINWKHYFVISLLTAVSGAVAGYGAAKWEQAYREAKEAGAVA